MNKSKILFISHEASLTGAPLVLLYFMEWLNEHHKEKFDVGILHLKGGEIEERFNAVANHVYHIENNKPKGLTFKIVNKLTKGKLARREKKPLEKAIEKIAELNYNIIYANTAVTIPVAVSLKKAINTKCKIIAHIHELEVILSQQKITPIAIESIDHYIAVSNLVKNNLRESWDVNENHIDVVYEFSKIDVENKSSEKKINSKFIVGGSGHVHWRKGHDAFIQVARYVNTNYPDIDIEFCWVGTITPNEKLIVDADLKKMNLAHKVKFVGQKKNPTKFFSEFDVFLMTSREDPFPLVCIEVAMLGKPIICFEGATGTQEILLNGGGKIIPYLSIEGMANSVIHYYNDKNLLESDSNIIKEAFKDFIPKIQCPKIYKILNQLSVRA